MNKIIESELEVSMRKNICICDICNKEMIIRKQYALGYQLKSYMLTNSECKRKMDICSDCMDKFEQFVKEQNNRK